MIFPILGVYRNSGYSLDFDESVNLALSNNDLFVNAISISIDRMNYLGVISTIIEAYKDSAEFLYDYLDNLIGLIPRVVWPDKPIIGIDLNALGAQLGILHHTNTNTSIGLTVIGESYYQLRDFGLIMAIFQGFLFGFLDKIKTNGSLMGHVYYFYIVTFLLFLDSYAYFLPQLVQVTIFLFAFGYLLNKPIAEQEF